MLKNTKMKQTKPVISMNNLPDDIIGYLVDILMNDCYNTMEFNHKRKNLTYYERYDFDAKVFYEKMKTLCILRMVDKYFNKYITTIIDRDFKKMYEYKNIDLYTKSIISFKSKSTLNMNMKALCQIIKSNNYRRKNGYKHHIKYQIALGVNENDITRANTRANKKSNPKQKVKLNKQCCNLTKKGIRCKHKCKYVICRKHNTMSREYEEKFHKMHKQCMKKINPISRGILPYQIKFH